MILLTTKQSNQYLRVAEPSDNTGDELANAQGLGSVGVQRVLEEQRKLLPHLKHKSVKHPKIAKHNKYTLPFLWEKCGMSFSKSCWGVTVASINLHKAMFAFSLTLSLVSPNLR